MHSTTLYGVLVFDYPCIFRSATVVQAGLIRFLLCNWVLHCHIKLHQGTCTRRCDGFCADISVYR
jgi:hypothetical protein